MASIVGIKGKSPSTYPEPPRSAGAGVVALVLTIDKALCQAQPPNTPSVTLSAPIPVGARFLSLLIGDTPPAQVLFDDPLHSQWFAAVLVPGSAGFNDVEVDVTSPAILPTNQPGIGGSMVGPPLLGQNEGFGGNTLSFTVSMMSPPAAPATVIGTVDLTTLTYGPGGSLDGTTLTITKGLAESTMNVNFVAPVSPADVLAQIDATLGGLPGNPPFTDFYTAFINGSNRLVINAAPTPTESFTLSGTALIVLGMAPGVYSPTSAPGDVTTATQGSISAVLLYANS